MKISAAQYLRTSRGEQQCSLEVQRIAIKDYAEQHGFTLDETYADEGKSGVTLKQRPGLTSLLHDVLSGNAVFKAVLVYDISRWGRFQDTDESAYYDFMCKHAGIPVHYCSEPFPSDSSIQSSVLKALKRSMAAEYSRELSIKSFNGQKKLVELGFHVGGKAGYGLQRMVLSADGRRNRVLAPGEYKLLSSDRIILVPGSPREVASIRTVFKMVLQNRSTPAQIARALNARHVPYRGGKPWNEDVIRFILRNPKYAGCNVWNRVSQRFRLRRAKNPSTDWVLRPRALPAIVSQATFGRAQELLRKRTDRQWTDEKLIAKLRWLLTKEGKLSARLIRDTPGMPSANTYYYHLGSLSNLYDFIGYQPRGCIRSDQNNYREGLLSLRNDLINRLLELFPEYLEADTTVRGMSPILKFNDGHTVLVHVVRRSDTPRGKIRWRLTIGRSMLRNSLILIALLNANNDTIQEYRLVPSSNTSQGKHQLRPDDPLIAASARFRSLSDFLDAFTYLPEKGR